MFRNISLRVAHLLFWISSIPNALRFVLGSKRVEKIQREVLRQILVQNSSTVYGKQHGFIAITTPKQFRESVPVNTYESLFPFIQEEARGERRTLTDDPIALFELTSGSTSASKLIPYTKGLRQDFRMGLDPWIFSLYLENPELFTGTVYWSLTPAEHEKKFTEGGIPIGFAQDEEYFGKIQQWVLDTIGIVPPEVKEIRDLRTFRYITLLFLLGARDLRFISIWNPTYLSLILGELPEVLPALIEDLKSGTISGVCVLDAAIQDKLKGKIYSDPLRAAELKSILVHRGVTGMDEIDSCGKTLYEEVWPQFALISCWCDGTAASQIPEITRMFPRVRIQPKGLLATEAFVSFPFFGRHSLLSTHSHFFEFEEVDSEKICLAHELRVGNQYRVIVTTSGGLYRYALGDIVAIVGFLRNVPIVRFVGRSNNVVDLVGEKLNESFVSSSVNRILERFGIKGTFWMVAPERLSANSYRYVLFVEIPDGSQGQLAKLGTEIEEILQTNYHYNYARKLGQLTQFVVFIINSGDRMACTIFLETCFRLGQQLGAIKLTRLHRYERWAEEFSGKFVET